MAETFYISDTHFGHEKTCTEFKREDGSPLRPFKNAEEMNEEMVRRWNNKVGPNDKVYVLGDVVIKKKYLSILGRLNGSKRLVRGNHDVFKTKEYQQYFKEIYGVRVLDDFILSHIPLHPSSITKRFNVNVHGHTHANKVKEWIVDPSGNDLLDVYIEDPRYLCVCVEHTMYAPLSHEEVLNLIKYQKEDWLRSGGKDFWAEAKDGDQNPG